MTTSVATSSHPLQLPSRKQLCHISPSLLLYSWPFIIVGSPQLMLYQNVASTWRKNLWHDIKLMVMLAGPLCCSLFSQMLPEKVPSA